MPLSLLGLSVYPTPQGYTFHPDPRSQLADFSIHSDPAILSVEYACVTAPHTATKDRRYLLRHQAQILTKKAVLYAQHLIYHSCDGTVGKLRFHTYGRDRLALRLLKYRF